MTCAQLLGDYDKVKAVSEGSDCRCKCLVRPLGRGACQRINEGAFKAEDFYTVETITSGPSCKCACVAPQPEGPRPPVPPLPPREPGSFLSCPLR